MHSPQICTVQKNIIRSENLTDRDKKIVCSSKMDLIFKRSLIPKPSVTSLGNVLIKGGYPDNATCDDRFEIDLLSGEIAQCARVWLEIEFSCEELLQSGMIGFSWRTSVFAERKHLMMCTWLIDEKVWRVRFEELVAKQYSVAVEVDVDVENYFSPTSNAVRLCKKKRSWNNLRMNNSTGSNNHLRSIDLLRSMIIYIEQ